MTQAVDFGNIGLTAEGTAYRASQYSNLPPNSWWRRLRIV